MWGCAQLGAAAVPLSGQHWGRSSAPLAGFGSNPVPAHWAQTDPGVLLAVCVLGHLLLLTLQKLSAACAVGQILARPKLPFLLEIGSHKAAYHVLLWAKKFVSK